MPTLRGGGAERNALRLAAGLAEEGEHVTVMVADARGPLRSIVPNNVTFVDLGAPILAWSIVGLTRWLRRHQPDIVVSFINGANVVALAARRLARSDVPVVVSERNTLSSWRTDSWMPDRRWIIPWIVRKLYPTAEAIVAVSQATALDLADHLGANRPPIEVVHNPVVDEKLAVLAAEQFDPELREWMQHGPAVVSVGRLVSQKDPVGLIEAFARAKVDQPDARLVIVGDGPLRRSVESAIQRADVADAVRLVGFVENPFPMVAAADGLVLNSRYEGLPTVVIEAMALGTAVVATDAPGGTGEVLGNGRWGRLVPPDDVDAMASAMRDLFAGNVAQAPAHAVDRYRANVVLATYVALIDRLRLRP